MRNDNLILCGGASAPGPAQKTGKTISLELSGRRQNATLKISDLSEKLVKNLPPRFVDLLEIATYVYCADQAISRGGDGVANMGADWRRQFHFVIPVREPTFWKKDDVQAILEDTLSFLSDDDFKFTFHKLHDPTQVQHYFEFDEKYESIAKPQEITLFSGGLDSLAGALDLIENGSDRPILISHRSNPKTAGWQKDLFGDLVKPLSPQKKPLHVPVWVHKDNERSRETTQRTRSFLYASLAAAAAGIFKLDTFKMYENGIISFNLPISAQVIGARATRTTHPKVLKGYSELLSQITGKQFTVENPFLWKTKAEVIELVKKRRPELIRYSHSCSHTHGATISHTHCGVCSQCIDRRFAVLASKSEKYDPAEMYAVDLLTGPRKPDVDRTMAESYVRTALELDEMSDAGFFSRFGEVNRAIRCLPITADQAGQQILDLHRRHAKEVTSVLTSALRQHADDILKKKLPNSCVLMLACEQQQPKQERKLKHSTDFTTVSYDGREWHLSRNQRMVVEFLITSLNNRVPEVHQDTILERFSDDIKSSRLKDVFKGSDAWGTLIVKGERNGTYRIAPSFSQ